MPVARKIWNGYGWTFIPENYNPEHEIDFWNKHKKPIVDAAFNALKTRMEKTDG